MFFRSSSSSLRRSSSPLCKSFSWLGSADISLCSIDMLFCSANTMCLSSERLWTERQKKNHMKTQPHWILCNCTEGDCFCSSHAPAGSDRKQRQSFLNICVVSHYVLCVFQKPLSVIAKGSPILVLGAAVSSGFHSTWAFNCLIQLIIVVISPIEWLFPVLKEVVI